MRHVIVGVALLTAAACAPKTDVAADSSVQQMGSANDPSAVRRTIDSTTATLAVALQKADTATLMRVYADDAIVMPAGAKAAHGRAAIGKWNADMFSMMSIPSAKFTDTDVIVAGDYAIETGSYVMTMQPKKGKAMDDAGKYLTVWKKQPDGSWKIFRDIFNSDKPGM